MKYIVVIGAGSEAPLYLSQVRLEDAKVRAVCFGQRKEAQEFSTWAIADFTAHIVNIFITEHLAVEVREAI